MGYNRHKFPKHVTPSTNQRAISKKLNAQRRALLSQWEATDMDRCWLTVWLAFREKGYVPDLPTPHLSHEWTDLRRWARNFLKAHSNVTGNPYNVIFDAHEDDILSVIHYIDQPNSSNWPLSTCPSPVTPKDLALAISALSPRIDRISTLP